MREYKNQPTEFGQWLESLRIKQGLNRVELGARIGMHPDSIRRVERYGGNLSWHLDALGDLIRTMHISFDELEAQYRALYLKELP